ncbi:ATP-binding protein [Nonomuraea sp. NPDC050328]|uniref:ATP-binding protein n=1 Tax=Nonomuraea sp. NPDC050328 TaxID=3364361 RepID=UPI0037A366EA
MTSLSGREAEVLSLLSSGMTNAAIAARLHLSVRTVESHVSSLLRKLGVPDRRALAGLHAPGEVVGLPIPRTRFIGRTAELEQAQAALAGSRMVTLVGAGGVGKTRLAVHLAAKTATAGAFVDLVPVREGYVVQAVAAALGVSGAQPGPLSDAVVERLASDRALLILDTCEHLLDSAAALAEQVLAACPRTRIIATSRERLGIAGELLVPIGPLPLGSEAEELFLDRAGVSAPEVCARLDGLPLALELAAARVPSLGVDGLLAGLDDRLRLLSGRRDPDERHRSLGAVIGWSHDLLDEQEQALFRRLGVFHGRFDLAAATAVSAGGERGQVADVLGRLVDKSLVVRQANRWRLLDTIRAYALDRLAESGEEAETRHRHLVWAEAFAEHLESRLRGDWREEFDAAVDDLHAHAPHSHRLARSLGHLGFARGYLAQAQDHYELAAGRTPDAAQAAHDLRVAASIAAHGSGEEAVRLLIASAGRAVEGSARAIALAQAVELYHRSPAAFQAPAPAEVIGSLLDQARTAGDPGSLRVAAHLALAAAWPKPGEADLALAGHAAAAARRTEDPVLICAALDAVGTALKSAGRYLDAARVSRERLALAERLDPDDPMAALEHVEALGVACDDAVLVGDLSRALELSWNEARTPTSRAWPVVPLALLGEFDAALEQAEAAWESQRRSGRVSSGWLGRAVIAAAFIQAVRGDRTRARLWRGRLVEMFGAENLVHMPALAFFDARLAAFSGDFTDAPRLVERAFARYASATAIPYARAAGAELAVLAGLPTAAALVEQAAETAEAAANDWARACLARTRRRIPEAIAGFERIGSRFERACTLLLEPSREPEGHAELAALGVIPPFARAAGG